MSRLRGGFDGEVDPLMQELTSSARADVVITAEDLEVSTAHVRMLRAVDLIDQVTAAKILDGLARIGREYETGDWRPTTEYDDVHMAVEARLTELVGEAGRCMHLARSRNDQVATDVRLWLRRRLDALVGAVEQLVATLVDRIEVEGREIIPGYTHLQRGQPILLGHHLLAHAWALLRDAERLADARRRANRSPLGACAMAGTSHPIDRQLAADLLGFEGPVENAMDAVASRDHLQEAVAGCALLMGHLSRMAAELVLWSSTELGLVRLADVHSTGSSIMPNKRNPDGAELIRGKAGRVFGHLQSLLVLTKGLPMAYNRDLQEDREATTDALAQTEVCLRLMDAMWHHLEIVPGRFEAELAGDPSLATDLADDLAARGIPFREAHEAVARLVRWCADQGGGLELADGGAARHFHPQLPADLGPWLDPRRAVERRSSFGGTAWSEVQRQAMVIRGRLGRPGSEVPS